MIYSVYQESRRGGRAVNQDRIGHGYTPKAILLVLADGMGGHARGEVAAQLMLESALKTFDSLARPRIANVPEFLLDCVYSAHAAINEYAIRNRTRDIPRTTCVLCLIQEGRAHWAHVGDSRLYHFGRERLKARTLDHSAVQQLLERGLISEDQIAKHPDRNKLNNSVGGYVLPNIELSPTVVLHEGDVLLLASDGFWAELSDDELLSTLRVYPTRQALVHLLDHAEYRAGEHSDNLSVIALRCGEEVTETARTMSDFGLEGFTTELRELAEVTDASPALSDGDIDKAIAEIQSALEKHALKP